MSQQEDIQDLAAEIKSRIKTLDMARDNLRKRGLAKAVAIVGYDKEMALTIIQIRNGKELELDGEMIENPPAAVLEKIAKGICWKAALEKEKAEALYKSLITGINALVAEINAFQSLLRIMQET